MTEAGIVIAAGYPIVDQADVVDQRVHEEARPPGRKAAEAVDVMLGGGPVDEVPSDFIWDRIDLGVLLLVAREVVELIVGDAQKTSDPHHRATKVDRLLGAFSDHFIAGD